MYEQRDVQDQETDPHRVREVGVALCAMDKSIQLLDLCGSVESYEGPPASKVEEISWKHSNKV